jgi:peptidyl-prolyl cis-trans isomerase SurA
MSRGSGLRAAAVLASALVVAAARAEIANRIVATIDGEPITAHELRRYAKENRGAQLPEDQLLQLLVTDKLLQKEIKAQGISAREEEIDRYIDEVRARNGLDADGFRRAVEGQGLGWDAYRARVKAEIEKAQLVNREIRQRVNVSPQEIRRYYDAHADTYGTPERVKVRDLVFVLDASADEAAVARVLAKAEEVRRLALDGRDFGALARQFSEGPGADAGGELGTFARTELDPALAEVVFALSPGEVSRPVRTGGAVHLLRLDERLPAGRRPLEDVSDEIREALYNDALEERFEQWMSRDLRERHHVEVLD